MKTNNKNKNNLTYLNHMQESIIRLKLLHLGLLKHQEVAKEISLGIALIYETCERLFVTRGPYTGTLYMKECRALFLAFLSKHSHAPTANLWVRRRKDLCPHIVRQSLYHLCKQGDEVALRNALTALFVTRNLQLRGAQPDYSTITDGSLPPLKQEFCSFVDSFVRRRRWTIPPGKFEVILSTSMGPHGPAMLGAFADLNVMPPRIRENLKVLTQESVLRDNFLRDDVEVWPALALPGVKLCRGLSIRRLTPIPDKEGKTRIIAIFDYWSQCSLKPLHNSLNDILKRLKEDCTFNQGNFIRLLNQPEGTVFHSVDLKAATDYMPVNYQEYVLSRLAGSEYAAAWRDVMVGLNFTTHDGLEIKYSQGQPMGAYSSWPMMALTHHIIIRFAASRKGIHNPKFAVLGDDALIVGDELFGSYLEVCDMLNMHVNLSKTFRSTRLIEFAKRFFYNRKEISAFPLGALLSSKCDMSKIAVVYDNVISKSWFTGRRYTECNTSLIRHCLFEQYRLLWQWHFKGQRDFDMSIVKRVLRLLNIIAITRICLHPDHYSIEELKKILPVSVRCNASYYSLVKRINFIWQRSLRDNAFSVLCEAHLPIYHKKMEVTEQLMMSGAAPPKSIDPSQPGFCWPHPLLVYMNKCIHDLMGLGHKLGESFIKDVSYEETNSWLDAMELLPASWEAISNDKKAVKRVRVMNTVAPKFFLDLQKGKLNL